MYIPEIPDNNLKPLLEELVYIAKKLDSEVSGRDRFRVMFEFNRPATLEEIDTLEKELNVSLPTGYKEFLVFSNGAQLCGNTAEFDRTTKVAKMDKWEKILDFPQDYITIANLIGDGEILCFSKKTNKFISYYEGEETVFENFYEFFKWLLSFIRDKAEDYVEL